LKIEKTVMALAPPTAPGDRVPGLLRARHTKPPPGYRPRHRERRGRARI